MNQLQLQYLIQDKRCPSGASLSDYDTLTIESAGCILYGQILWPDGEYAENRPCVVLFHGLPGSARNDDLAHAMCRIGCVVLTPHNRGAWGSDGVYLPSNCVEDAVNIANYIHSREFCDHYHVDPDNIFFVGHSMGGNTVLNAGKTLPWLRGLILMAPFDPTRFLRDGEPEELRAPLAQFETQHCIRCVGEESLYRDIVLHTNTFAFENAYEQVKDQNVLFLEGDLDDCAPANRMVEPLLKMLQKHKTGAIQRIRHYPAGHGLLGCRTEIIRDVAQFLSDSLNTNKDAKAVS